MKSSVVLTGNQYSTYRYGRTMDGSFAALIVIDPDSGCVYVSISLCNPKDIMSKETARSIADKRMKRGEFFRYPYIEKRKIYLYAIEALECFVRNKIQRSIKNNWAFMTVKSLRDGLTGTQEINSSDIMNFVNCLSKGFLDAKTGKGSKGEEDSGSNEEGKSINTKPSGKVCNNEESTRIDTKKKQIKSRVRVYHKTRS